MSAGSQKFLTDKGDIVNLAPYHFYMKVTGDEAEDTFSGETMPLDVNYDCLMGLMGSSQSI